MKNLIDSNGHATPSALHDFANNSLNSMETMMVAEHITVCEKCASALSEMIPDKEMIVPAGFEEEVQKKLSKEKKKSAELCWFSARVVLAASITLFLAFSGVIRMQGISRNSFTQITAPNFSIVENINTQLQNFSRQLLDMEVFKNDKKAK